MTSISLPTVCSASLLVPSVGTRFGFAYREVPVGEREDVNFGWLLSGPAEVQFSDVLEGPGGCCERSAGQVPRHVTVLFEELTDCAVQIIEPFRFTERRPPGGAGIGVGAAPRADVGFTESADSVEGAAFALAARHDEPTVKRADPKQVVDSFPNCVSVQSGQSANSGSERETAFTRRQPNAVAVLGRPGRRLFRQL